MKIYFVRHAEAEKADGRVKDEERSLKKSAKKRLNKKLPFIAEYLSAQKHLEIWTSELNRALETAESFNKFLEVKQKKKDFLKTGNYEEFKKEIEESGKDLILIIGHEPHLSSWTKNLTGKDVTYEPSEVKLVYMDEERTRGELIWTYKDLSELDLDKKAILNLASKDFLVEYALYLNEKILIAKDDLRDEFTLDGLVKYSEAITSATAFLYSLSDIISQKKVNDILARYSIERQEVLHILQNLDSLHFAENARRKSVVKNLSKEIEKEDKKFLKYLDSQTSGENIEKAIRKMVKAIEKADMDIDLNEYFSNALSECVKSVQMELAYLNKNDFKRALPAIKALERYVFLADAMEGIYIDKKPEHYDLYRDLLDRLKNINYENISIEKFSAILHQALETKKDRKALVEEIKKKSENSKKDFLSLIGK